MSNRAVSVSKEVPLPISAFPAIVIKPSKGWTPWNLKELWEYRELFYFLLWRDIKVRYAQTVLGAGWAIIQPVVAMVVFTIIFGKVAKIPSDGLPYPVFTYAALLPWQLFAYSLAQSSNSLVGNRNLITKVYFPRVVMPLSSALGALVDFMIASVVLLGLMAFYGIVPTVAVLMLPFFILLALVTALGVGLWLSALNVHYRDVRYGLPFLIQIWLFVTPVVYPSSLVPEQWRILYGLNPMAGVVEGFRWALFGTPTGPGPMMATSVFVALALFVFGIYYFRRTERTFADIV